MVVILQFIEQFFCIDTINFPFLHLLKLSKSMVNFG